MKLTACELELLHGAAREWRRRRRRRRSHERNETADARAGILPFVIALGPDERTTARAGLTLVVEALRAVRLDDVVLEKLCAVQRRRDFTALDKIEALALLIASRGDRIEDIRILSDDQGLLRLLGGALPSPDALLDFLAAFDDPELGAARPEDEAAFVPEDSTALRALDEVLVQSVGCIAGPYRHRPVGASRGLEWSYATTAAMVRSGGPC